jgi:hypothetical protein
MTAPADDLVPDDRLYPSRVAGREPARCHEPAAPCGSRHRLPQLSRHRLAYCHHAYGDQIEPRRPAASTCGAPFGAAARCTATALPGTKEDVVHASIIDMTLRLPIDEVLFDELRTDFLPKAAQHPGFCGFQYVLAEHGRAVGILWYERPEDLDGITRLVGTWFQDHIAPRLAGPETAMRGRVVVNMTLPRTTRT